MEIPKSIQTIGINQQKTTPKTARKVFNKTSSMSTRISANNRYSNE